MCAMLQVRIDDDLKLQATKVYDQLGIDLSTAVRMFLKKSVAVNGVPFDVKNDSSAERARAAVRRMQDAAEANGASELTLDEINEIIRKTREERKKRE